MQQLCDKVYIEHTYPGVTVGAILGDCSLVLIDAPLRPEDGRQWKHSTSGLYSGKERLIVALNGHPDRTLGIKNLDAQVVGHERLMRVYDHRTQIFKPPPVESGFVLLKEPPYVTLESVTVAAASDHAFTQPSPALPVH